MLGENVICCDEKANRWMCLGACLLISHVIVTASELCQELVTSGGIDDCSDYKSVKSSLSLISLLAPDICSGC